ncbi:MAG: hypothetical protein NPINA01_16330 [Nitrospinaceae bacterium]|nr:MAG: hypothetical protein NPINA01_16330 [Nitrospinaceae bacterium]
MFPWIRAGVFVFLLVGAQGCATSKITDGTFVQAAKSYSFSVPEVGWQKDKDAWVYERELGHVIIKKHRSRYALERSNRQRTNNRDDIEIRPRPPKTYEKLIWDLDVGFQHPTQPMQILVGTIPESDLIKFLKGKFIKTDSDLPDNLLAGYMERLQFLHPPDRPAQITTKNLPSPKMAKRLEWADGKYFRALYGVALHREYLFVLLRANQKVPVREWEEGTQTLDRLIETLRFGNPLMDPVKN